MTHPWPLAPLSEALEPVSRPESVDPEKTYKILGAHWYAKGLYVKDILAGSEIRADKVYRVEPADFVYNRLFAWKGSFAVAGQDHDDCYVSNEFPCFAIKRDTANPTYLWKYFSRKSAWDEALSFSTGGTPTSRNRLKEQQFLALKVPLPSLPEQRRIVARIEQLTAKINDAHRLRQQAAEESKTLILRNSIRIFETLTSTKKPLGTVADKRTGVAYKAQDFDSAVGVPVVRIKEIETKKPTVFLRNPEAYANIWLQIGDIVLAKTSFSTGTMCQWTGPAAVLNQNAVMLRAKPGVEQRYLFLWLRQQVYRYLRDHLADPNFYPYIREADLIKWLVPVPEPTEQQRIMAELEGFQAQVDALETLQAATATELDALLPSILDQAFKGEL
jgi:type I restriction enzyme S subunit